MAAAPEKYTVEEIPLADIFVVGSRRETAPAAVEKLAASIGQLGLRTPITVRVDDTIVDPETGEVIGGYAIVTGRHRVEACRALGWERIPAIVSERDEIDAQLWEIAENLHRADLTVLERDEQIGAWVRLTAEKVSFQSETKPQGGRPESGVRAASRELGIDHVDAHRATKVAGLSDAAKEAAREVGLDDNRTALLEAAKAAPDKQASVIRDYSEKKTSDRNSIDGDVKARAAREVASIIAEHVPGEWWDAIKSNLYAAGAKNIANELTNISGQSIMDRRYG